MIIHKIWAENARGIKDRVICEPSPTGVTLLHAPNEFGKSTLAEVISILFTNPHTSSAKYVKELQRPDSKSGPTLGAEFSIGDERYSLEKTWINGKTARLIQLEPSHIEYPVGSASEDRLTELKESFDETLWGLLQLKQGTSYAALGILETTKDSVSLSKAFDLAVQALGSDDSTILEKITSEYGRWYSETGRELSAKTSMSAKLKEARERLQDLKVETEQQAKAIEELDSLEGEKTEISADVAQLERLAKIQGILIEERALVSKRREVDAAFATANGAKGSTPAFQNWKPEKFEALSKSLRGYLAYSSLPTAVITALKPVSFSDDKNVIELAQGEEHAIPVSDGVALTIGDVATLAFRGAISSAENRVAHDNFCQLLNELSVVDFEEAERINRDFTKWRSLQDTYETLAENIPAGLQERLTEIETQRAQDPELWKNAELHDPVTPTMLLETGAKKGQSQARIEIAREASWTGRLENLKRQCLEAEVQVTQLELEQQGIRLLFETVITAKQRELDRYSKVFETELNLIAKNIFGADTVFSVDNDFTIRSRNQKGMTLKTDQLSVGALEQLSMAARIALAKLASSVGTVPLILDDDLSNTDATRLQKVGAIFEQFPELQVLIFSCHPERFRTLNLSIEVDLLAHSEAAH